MESNLGSLDETLATIRKWLHVPDPGVVEIALATIVANRIPGDPVWVLLVGGPSDGKTEVLNSLLELPRIFPVSTLTEAALLSGSSRRDTTPDATGGLLHKMGEFGILVFKDFTSILSMTREKRPGILAALREVYDGAWTRHVGVDGAKTLQWHGKAGMIGGVTSSIDSAHAVMSSMGERFALYRLPETEPVTQGRRALDSLGREQEMRAELSRAVCTLFQGLDFANPPTLAKADQSWLVALAALVVSCRSAVDRNAYSHDIELVHCAERPARLARVLGQLLRGLQLIGVKALRRRELIVKVGLDCIPVLRRLVLDRLLKEPEPLTTSEIAKDSNYSESTIRRALEELACHNVVVHSQPHLSARKADAWHIAPFWREQCDVARGTFPNSQ